MARAVRHYSTTLRAAVQVRKFCAAPRPRVQLPGCRVTADALELHLPACGAWSSSEELLECPPLFAVTGR